MDATVEGCDYDRNDANEVEGGDPNTGCGLKTNVADDLFVDSSPFVFMVFLFCVRKM